MTRTVLEQRLAEIQEEMLVMADMVESAIHRSIQALKDRNVALAKQIVVDDLKINRKRYDIEERCIELIAMQQPLAGDLRIIVAVLHMTVDLERMGDHAEGIAKIVLLLADQPPLKPYVDLPRMAELAAGMLKESLEAFKYRDADRARAVMNRDDEVDALYDQVYRELLTYMIADPRSIERATHLIWVAHNLERIGDRVTNICERVVYLVTGKVEELNVSTY